MAATDRIVRAFSEEQVERLTGVSKEQLRYWDRTGFFKPSLASENRRLAYSRIYSFHDVASLRVLNELRNKHNVPLQHLRKVAQQLAHLSDAKWTATELFVLNKKVLFVEPGSRQHREIVSKQYVLALPLKVVVSDTKRAVEQLRKRDSGRIGKVSRSKFIGHNAWMIAGTRIPVATIKRFAEDGFSIQEIMREYPTLTEADIKAALEHEGNGLAA
jgi:DNA-binding transcriptional MerR regulator